MTASVGSMQDEEKSKDELIAELQQLRRQQSWRESALAPDDSTPADQTSFNRLLMDSFQEGVCGIAPSGAIMFINASGASLLGYQESELVDRPWASVLAPAHPHGSAAERSKQTLGEFLTKDGSSLPVEYSVAPMLDHDRPIGTVWTFRDLKKRKQAEDSLMRLAYIDPLTNLPNRLLFQDRLAQVVAMARRNKRLAAVMWLDLDRFKLINDTLGHDVGDQLIREISSRLMTCLRDCDTVSRLGGDEFGLILTEIAEIQDAVKVSKRVFEALTAPFMCGSHELRISASIGISIFPADGEDPSTLIKNADVAMYRAKENRNSYEMYSPAMNVSSADLFALENNLHRAIERDELIVYYQPQVSFKTGQIMGAEALLRWRHPEFGLVSPAKFIPLAEETGLIVPITEWVLATACKQTVAWHEAGHEPFSISVNLSARNFKGQDLVGMVTRVLAETGLNPCSLELELTENIFMENIETSAKMLRSLSYMGIQFSIDDFGTKYSSLSYLKRFPINTLKIDQCFVRDLATDKDSSAIVSAIIALAHSLHLKVVAEGVETSEQLAMLQTQHCDELQGYYFSRPVPVDEFTELLTAKRALVLP